MIRSKQSLLLISFMILFFTGGILCQTGAPQPDLTVEMDPDGRAVWYNPIGEEDGWFNKGDEIKIVIRSANQRKLPAKTKGTKDFHYKIVIEDILLESNIPIYVGPTAKLPGKKQRDIIHADMVELERSGRKYTIKVIRYDSFDEKLKDKNGAIIYLKGFKTHIRHTFGLDIGIFAPVYNTQEKVYSIKYEGPDDLKPTLSEETFYRSRVLILASFYPFKYEPTRHFCDKTHKRLKFNFGTEVSKNLLEKFYFGIGVELKRISISLLGTIGQDDELDPQYTPFMFVDPAKITSVPLKKNKRSVRVGISFNIPFSFASGLAGKIFGI